MKKTDKIWECIKTCPLIFFLIPGVYLLIVIVSHILELNFNYSTELTWFLYTEAVGICIELLRIKIPLIDTIYEKTRFLVRYIPFTIIGTPITFVMVRYMCWKVDIQYADILQDVGINGKEALLLFLLLIPLMLGFDVFVYVFDEIDVCDNKNEADSK